PPPSTTLSLHDALPIYQVSQLPLNGRNFIELTTLMPGTAVGGGFDNKNKGLLAGVDISFSGAPANANQWRVNGTNNNDQGSKRTDRKSTRLNSSHVKIS